MGFYEIDVLRRRGARCSPSRRRGRGGGNCGVIRVSGQRFLDLESGVDLVKSSERRTHVAGEVVIETAKVEDFSRRIVEILIRSETSGICGSICEPVIRRVSVSMR